MDCPDSRVDEIVRELLDARLPKEVRVDLYRELVRVEGEVPEELFEAALVRLMERLTE